MKVEFKKSLLSKVKTDLLCIFLMEDEKPPKEVKDFAENLKDYKFKGKSGDIFHTSTLGKASFKNLLLVGLGKKKDFKLDNVRKAAGASISQALCLKQKECSIFVPETPGGPEKAAQAITEGALLAGYTFNKFKTKKEDLFEVERIGVLSEKDLSKSVQRGIIYANAQNFSRELDEHPANIATPLMVAKQAEKLGKEKKLDVKVYGKKELEKMRMNSILAVSQGSSQPPVLVKIEYNKGKKYPLYCVVGKGITFDSGGISLKPSKNMHEMKYDKSGAINVLGVMKAVSDLKIPLRVMGLMALSENVPSGSAQKPGDIITSYSGKTIEVLNTDAEGRLVLADALSFAAKQKPKAIIDMATLTGAIVVSLGRHAIGLFSNDDNIAKTMSGAGEETHERVWRLPVWPEYGEMMKSDIADLKNISEQGEAGSITAAAFLQEFVEDVKWVHLDIAAVEVSRGKHSYLSKKGATGVGVRLVTRTLEMLAKKG